MTVCRVQSNAEGLFITYGRRLSQTQSSLSVRMLTLSLAANETSQRTAANFSSKASHYSRFRVEFVEPESEMNSKRWAVSACVALCHVFRGMGL